MHESSSILGTYCINISLVTRNLTVSGPSLRIRSSKFLASLVANSSSVSPAPHQNNFISNKNAALIIKLNFEIKSTRKMEAPVVRAVCVQNKRCWQIELLVQGRKTKDTEAISKVIKHQ